MKKNLLLIAMLLIGLKSFAQFGTCIPDQSYIDSTVGVYPLPYDPISTPDGGIDKSACIGKPYQFNFTIVVQDTVNFPGLGLVPLNSFSIDTTGAIGNLPNGLKYSCNPPNCIFLKNTVGCVAIYGTVAAGTPIQDYDLNISGKLSTFLDIPFVFPNAALAPGNYFLKVEPENSSTCYVVATNEARLTNVRVELASNPVANDANFVIYAKKSGQINLDILNINGSQLIHKSVFINEGRNDVQLDVSNVPQGVQLFRLSQDGASSTGKMTVQR